MCIVISGETQPDTTKLMNIPVDVNGVKSNFFMYINNFDLQTNKKPKKNNFNYYDNYTQFSLLDDAEMYDDFIVNQKNSNYGSIMVVPFAVDPHTPTSQIGLVDISTDRMKELRQEIKSLKPVKLTRSLLRNN